MGVAQCWVGVPVVVVVVPGACCCCCPWDPYVEEEGNEDPRKGPGGRGEGRVRPCTWGQVVSSWDHYRMKGAELLV